MPYNFKKKHIEVFIGMPMNEAIQLPENTMEVTAAAFEKKHRGF